MLYHADLKQYIGLFNWVYIIHANIFIKEPDWPSFSW